MKTLLTKLKNALCQISLTEEDRTGIQNALSAVLSDEKLLKTASEYYEALFLTKAFLGREIIEWDDLYSNGKLGDSMIFTVIMFARAYELTESKKYIYNGKYIDFYSTLLRHFDINKSRGNCTGLKSSQRFWAYCYLKPIAFELGRLAFEITDYNFGFEVYCNKKTHESVPIALSGLRFDENGFPDEFGSFITDFSCENDTLYGYTYDNNGHIDFKKRAFHGYKRVLKQSDKVLSVHMPGNEKLSENAVSDSLNGAKAFFAEYFPTLDYKAFVCSSWLLDTGLRKFLNEESNILKLQKRFRIALAFKNTFSLFDNIFNVPKCPVENLVPENRFQREILNMIKSGGSLYSGRGYILKHKI